MNLPNEILNKIIELSYNVNKKEISKDFRKISDKYMGEKNGISLLSQDCEAIAYSISRMPATYTATLTACKQIFEIIDLANKQRRVAETKNTELEAKVDRLQAELDYYKALLEGGDDVSTNNS